jgi:hypothetical protein
MTDKKRTYGKEFQLQGVAAVWQVASQLALRGHNVLFPGLDEGFDLQLTNGLRLQVKSARLKIISGVNYPMGAYGFGLRRGAWDSAEKKYKRSNYRPYSEVADFFVLWGIDENRFFILPTSHARKAVWFSRKGFESKSQNAKVFGKISAQRLSDMEDRWDLLDVSGSSEELVESVVAQETISSQFELS